MVGYLYPAPSSHEWRYLFPGTSGLWLRTQEAFHGFGESSQPLRLRCDSGKLALGVEQLPVQESCSTCCLLDGEAAGPASSVRAAWKECCMLGEEAEPGTPLNISLDNHKSPARHHQDMDLGVAVAAQQVRNLT